MCELKALRDFNPSGCEGALWQCNIDPGEDLCPAVLVKTRVCGGFSFSRAHKTSLKSILFCICHERDCPLTSRDWDHLERLVRCVISIPLWGHFARAREGDTRVSLSCVRSFLRPLLTSATLGARDFSSAVSGFCQVFIATRGFGLRPKMCRPSATAREKNLWYPGYPSACYANFFEGNALGTRLPATQAKVKWVTSRLVVVS